MRICTKRYARVARFCLNSFAFASVALFFGCTQQSDVVKIGCITPLTGEGATYGAATQKGLDLAKEEINSKGGLNGKPISIIYEDDQMSPRVGTNALQKLMSIDKVPVIVGAFGSSVTLAIAPIAERGKTVLFSASSTADEIKDSGAYIFRNVPPNRGQGKTAAEFALDHLHAKTASVLKINNDYGVSLTDSFSSSFEKGGGRILSDESYNQGATDFRAQLTKIREEHPDIVFYPGHYQECGLILKQARELGIAGTFVGGDGSYSPELIQIAGPAAEGSYYTLMAMGYGVSDKEIQTFSSAFKAKYGQEPDVYAAYAYDALMIIADAIRRGGYTSDGIKSALYSTKAYKGVTGITSFDSNGEVSKPFGLYQVKDGKFDLLSWAPPQGVGK
jgi:branched-chain amino acid transport system substrate-binding protein